MSLILIVLVLVFCSLICIVEIPKMWNNKEFKELSVFSILLCCGIVLAILKIVKIDIPNPADFIKFIYSPIVKLMKGALE